MRGALASLLVALVVGGCGGSPASEGADERRDDPVHVHGLGIDPADGALYVATHTGLFRAATGDTHADRVGESRQDTMGFTVVGPNRFVGSGHPDPQAAVERGLPPHLGLIESRDAGRTWHAVSLAGEADFHVLRASGGHVYGVDASHARFLVSADGGRTWDERALPASPYDLAVHAAQPTRLVATTEAGVAASNDAGRTWRNVGPAVPALLAWPAPRSLYALLGDGSVRVSHDAGRTWRGRGSVGAEPAAFASAASDLYVALHDGTIKVSRDGGRTWHIRSLP